MRCNCYHRGMTVQNAKQFGKLYYAKHMVQGVVGYENEKILVTNDAIRAMNSSFEGRPVYVQHQPVDMENLHKADGTVVRSFYNKADGWWWLEMMITSDEGHEAVKKGWAVSNAYIPTEWGSGGQYLAVDYQRKVINGEFTHLAIVPNPRYEAAQILCPDDYAKHQAKMEELQNEKEKPKGIIPMFKIFKKTVAETELTNEADVTDEAIIKIGDAEMTIAEFRAAALENAKAKKNEDEADKDARAEEKENEETTDEDVELDDDKPDMKNKKKKNAKKNSEADSEKDEKEKANSKTYSQADLDDAVAKATKAAVDAAAEKEKNFKELANANKPKAVPVEIGFNQVQRGRETYGSAKKA